MKIAILTKYVNYHGGTEVFHNHLKEILERNFGEVEILAPNKSQMNLIFKFLVRLTGGAFLTKHFRAKLPDYDIVICNGEHGWGINHPKCICIFHGTYYGYKKYLKGKLKLRSYLRLTLLSFIQKRASQNKYIVAVSNLTKNLLSEQKIKVDTIINGCVRKIPSHTNLFFKKNGKLLFVGRYDYYGKGFDILEDIADAGYTIDCVTDQNPGNKLNWLKIRSHNEILELYNKYSLLVFPSRYEGSPLVPIEAMASGLPVVLSNVGYYDFQVEISEFIVTKNSADNFIERINVISNNYKYFSERAVEYVKKHYSFSKFENNVKKMVNNLINS